MAKKKVSFLITAKDQASKVFRMLNSTMKTVSKTVGGITKALGKFPLVTGATATVTLLSKRIMDQVDSIDKVSKKIGVTAEFYKNLDLPLILQELKLELLIWSKDLLVEWLRLETAQVNLKRHYKN